jgi:uncharacterized membrane protein YbhN (UPF0104 family)
VKLASSPWLRAAVSALLLAIVLVNVDFDAAAERLDRGSALWVLGSVVVVFAGTCVGAVRWRLFVVAAGVTASSRRTVAAFFAGAFATNLLPTGFGGDAVRGWLGSPRGSRTRAYASVLADRITILGCALLLAWAALAAAAPLPSPVVGALGAATAAYAVGLAAIFVGLRLLGTRRSPPTGRLASIAADAAGGLRSALAGRSLLVSTTALGLAYEASTVTAMWLVASGLDVEVSWLELAVVLPPILILSAIPITIGGLGVREASYVGLLAPLDVGVTAAALVSLVGAAAYLVATLPGALVVLRRRG